MVKKILVTPFKGRSLVVLLVMILTVAVTPMATVVHANQPIKVATQNIIDGHNSQREYIKFDANLQPVILNDRVYVPLRALEGIAGIYNVEWRSWVTDSVLDSQGRPAGSENFAGVSVSRGGTMSSYFMIFPNSNTVLDAYISDGEDYPSFSDALNSRFAKMELSEYFSLKYNQPTVPAIIINDRMMIPLRVLEVMGYGVTWEASTKTVLITYAMS